MRPYAAASGHELETDRQDAREMILPMDVTDSMDARPQPAVRANSQIVLGEPVARVCYRGRFIPALVELAVVGALLLLGSGCGEENANRAPGLPSEVPLPAQSAFVKQPQHGCSTCAGQSWYFTVAGIQPSQIASFYTAQLPKRGWREVDCQLYSPEHAHCLARDSHGVLTIMGMSQPWLEIAPPRGGIVLAITLLATGP